MLFLTRVNRTKGFCGVERGDELVEKLDDAKLQRKWERKREGEKRDGRVNFRAHPTPVVGSKRVLVLFENFHVFRPTPGQLSLESHHF